MEKEVCESSGRIGYSGRPTLEESCEVKLEVHRVINQARLGHLLRKEAVWRYKGQSCTEDRSDEGYGTRGIPMITSRDLYGKSLKKHKGRWVTKLTGIRMLASTVSSDGTLEAHVNGFTFSSSGCSDVVFMHDKVQVYFYGCELGGLMQVPFLRFHMKHRMVVLGTETKDILFRLGECMRAEELLKDFVRRVPEIQWKCEDKMPLTPVEFEALNDFIFPAASPTGAPADISLTPSALVVLEPYSVVLLSDILIVNLARIASDIEMTVVFKDLDRGMLEFRSIRLDYLIGIKDRLNKADMKYFVNNFRPSWSKLVSEIRECPEKFIVNGGWEFLEDTLTLACYPPPEDSYAYVDSEDCLEKEM